MVSLDVAVLMVRVQTSHQPLMLPLTKVAVLVVRDTKELEAQVAQAL
jgi:hypothetical protein